MDKDFALIFYDQQKNQLIAEIKKCNGLTGIYSLSLNEEQICLLLDARRQALKDTGRIEFTGGILKKLIEAFCDCPYINQENYVSVLMDLQDLFYYFKGECLEALSDDELIETMKNYFNTTAQGSMDYLSALSIEELCGNDATERSNEPFEY